MHKHSCHISDDYDQMLKIIHLLQQVSEHLCDFVPHGYGWVLLLVLCVQNLHGLPGSMWVSSSYSGLLLQSKDTWFGE